MALHHHSEFRISRDRKPVTETGDRFTEQHHASKCDVVSIINQYARTGVVTHMTGLQGRYEDLPDGLDYQEALHRVQAANEAFASLPSALRARYGNSQRDFLEALSNPAEYDHLVEAGIFSKRQATVSPDGATLVEDVKPT